MVIEFSVTIDLGFNHLLQDRFVKFIDSMYYFREIAVFLLDSSTLFDKVCFV